MTISRLLLEKKEKKIQLRKKFNITWKTRALWWICPEVELTEDFLEGLSFCEADFIVMKDISNFTQRKNIFTTQNEVYSEDVGGFDFFLCNGKSQNIHDFLKEGIVPLVYKKNYLSSILKDFNPIKGEGNSFFYDEENKWSMYTALIKYLENYKFPYDNKNLVKNLLNI